MLEEIKNNLSKSLDKSLVDDLLDDYSTIKKYHLLGQHENAIIISGKFVETVFQILKYILSGTIDTSPSINTISQELENTPKGAYPESIRIIIPRSANAIYTIRSRRGYAHKSKEISPNHIDSEFVVSTCDWILAEFLRLYHNDDIDAIQNVMNSIVEKKVPLIEEFEDDVYVLSTELSTKEQILLILYHFHPKNVSNKDLTKWLKGYPQLITTNLRNAEKEKLIHRNGKKNRITRLGIKKVEEILSKSEIP